MSRANTRKSAVKTRAKAAASRSVTASGDFFGPPPLLEGEDEAAYFGLLEKVGASVKPSGVLEEIATRDFVNITWEILRLRRMRQSLISAEFCAVIEKALSPCFGSAELREMCEVWLTSHYRALSEASEFMEEVGLKIDDLHARAFEAKIETVERVDRMIAQAEHRRRLIIVELDRSRDVLARRLREAANVINLDTSAGVGGAPQLTSVARAP
jgi:hypothetical protein